MSFRLGCPPCLLSPSNCVTLAGYLILVSPLVKLGLKIPTSRGPCKGSEGMIHVKFLTHTKSSLNGCYRYFYSQDLHIWKEISFSVCISVKFSSHFILGGLHQFFVVAFPAPNPRSSRGPCSSSQP